MSRSILITGCSTGIGYACAHALQKAGYQVIASCRQQADVDRLISEGLTCLQLDLASSESIANAVEEVRGMTEGKLYGLFNNGAYGQPGAIEDLSTDALREQFETNFFGWHQLTTAVLPMMRDRGEGRIVQNSSVLGFVALRYRGAYNASKFAIEGWSDTLRLELMGSNIHISLIEPGPIESAFRKNALTAIKKHIDIENSVHSAEYADQLARLGKEDVTSKYTLPAEAIVAPLRDALENPRPKARYRVTTPTKISAVLKRLLPTRRLDAILYNND
ncbi:SDR family oxidoreductase [Thaumasiovibrio subtropicus]|uniref:SDR family oxidoreductase n=1 Tax=Thaumasiovibrio subtropicus TaxID=1891207 RepID=UPI000B353515|nr:SDR family oxidoreductase [Thaumasiovibrio subtropicus]